MNKVVCSAVNAQTVSQTNSLVKHVKNVYVIIVLLNSLIIKEIQIMEAYLWV